MPIPDDVAEFLGGHTRGFLVTRRKDGSPTIHPMAVFFANGRVTMSTYRESVKVRNVERDPRAAVLVVNGYGGDDVRAALARGRGEIRRAEGAAMPPSTRAVPKVSGGVAGRVAERMASGKRIFLDVVTETAEFVQRLRSA